MSETHRASKVPIGATILVVVCGFLALLLLTLGRSVPPPPALPSPNGYDGIQAAAKNLPTNQTLLSPDLASIEELRAAVALAQPAFEQANAALKMDFRVPAVNQDENAALAALSRSKSLGRAYVSAGLLAEKEGSLAEAAQLHLKSVELGNKLHDGNMLAALVGVSVEKRGLTALDRVVPQLGAAESAVVANTLLDAERTREPWGTILATDESAEFHDANIGLRIVYRVAPPRTAREKALAKYQDGLRHLRSTMIATAARRYELDRGKPPGTTADLVPQYLPQLPLDPVSRLPLPLH